MQITNTHEAKTNLSKLIDQVLAGKEVVIGRFGKPMIKLIPYVPTSKTRKRGLLKGKIQMSGDFMEEDKEINELFYGKDL